MDLIFWYTILFIFLSAVTGAFLNSRIKDRCLKDFRNFQVTLEEIDGDQARGDLVVYSTGLELIYPAPIRDLSGYIETSYIIYKDQFTTIQGIYRYFDQLSAKSQKQREKSIRNSYHPNIFRRMLRSLRNILNTFKDSLMQSVGLIVGQAQKTHPKSTLLQSQNKRITSLSQEIINVSANAYEPILEKYIGKKVVLDVRKGEQDIEYAGILKEYTHDFIELLDIDQREARTVEMPEAKLPLENDALRFSHNGPKFSVENQEPNTLVIQKIETENRLQEMEIVCPPFTLTDFSLEKPITSGVKIHFERLRKMDVIIPRKYCLVRHGGEVMQ